MRKTIWLAMTICALAGGGLAWGDETKTSSTTIRASGTVKARVLTPAAPAIQAAPSAAPAATPAGRATSALFRALGVAVGANDAAPAAGASAPTLVVPAAPAPPAQAPPEATHQAYKTVKVTGEQGATLQTLAATPDGNVACLLGPSRYAVVGAPGATMNPQSEVRLFDRDGQEVRRWPVTFTGQAIAVGPKADIFVAGDGRVARYSSDGKLDVEVEVPHILKMLKDDATLERQAQAQIKSSIESYENEITNLKTQIAQIDQESKEPLPAPKQQELRLLKSQLQAYENAIKSVRQQDVKSTVRSITSRMRIINGLSVTDKDIYLMCGETQGYGYSLWRMDLKLTTSEKVLSKLSGCCGQMDVQARGDQIVIAENTRHRVARYDRDGTLADSFGTRGRESTGANFGGCCNPMNCRIMSNGDVYTAESEGIIKKFNDKGEFVAMVGMVRLTGGCKNVAVAATATGDRVYFCDQPGSQFVILEQKPAAAAANAGGGS